MISLARIWAGIRIGILGHVLNWPWRERYRRRQVRSKVLEREIPRYFKRYLPAAAAVPLTPAIKNDEHENVFSFWGFRAMPKLVESCTRSKERHLTQKLKMLDEKTLFDYVDLPGYLMDKYRRGKIAPAHFTDVARVELLHNHGGFWLDATAFVTAPIPKNIVDQDFFVYLAGSHVGSPYSFIQNCFIRSRQGAYLLEAWRAMILDFWKHEPSNFDYFMHQLLFKTLVENDPRGIEFFAKMPHIDQDPTHALWWGYHDKPFDKKLFDELTSGAFFQKLTYGQAQNPIPGSFADAILKM